MNYDEALEYIRGAGDISLGLETMERLMSAMGDPHKGLNAIHIAGTNGKGSVGAFIEAGLMHRGYSVGRYLSPAIFDERDIITYNGVPISREDFASAVAKVKNAADKSDTEPTPFEIETAAAFYYLKNRKCDYTIIETGMGGRLDATNVVDKILAVITPIGLDHTAFLGSTIEEIAAEKAGIIKGRAISALQSEGVRKILTDKSGEIIFSGKAENIMYKPDRTIFNYKSYKNIEIPLLGINQVENAVLAIEVLEKICGFATEDFKSTVWRCRFEKIGDNIFADGAHNPQGAEALAENIRLYCRGKRIAFVTGVLRDKDYCKMAEITGPLAEMVYTVTPDSPRALEAKALKNVYSRYTRAEATDSIENALDRSMDYDIVIVFGTFTIMKSVYKYLRG